MTLSVPCSVQQQLTLHHLPELVHRTEQLCASDVRFRGRRHTLCTDIPASHPRKTCHRPLLNHSPAHAGRTPMLYTRLWLFWNVEILTNFMDKNPCKIGSLWVNEQSTRSFCYSVRNKGVWNLSLALNPVHTLRMYLLKTQVNIALQHWLLQKR